MHLSYQSFMMLMLPALTFALICKLGPVYANTEKVIFVGPEALQVPAEHPTIEDLQLQALSPQHWSLRTHIQAEFPTKTAYLGQASWVLLHGLQEGQRYEVRICWAAIVSLPAGELASAHSQ